MTNKRNPGSVTAWPVVAHINSSRPRRLKITVAAVTLLVVIAIGVAITLGERHSEVRSADGSAVRLESYAFRAGKVVRYELPNRPVARVIRKVLPERIAMKVQWLRPESTVFCTGPFPNEPFLSAAFSARDAAGKRQDAGTRLVVLDDRGQVFDSGINYMGASSVFEVSAFPRRGAELRLRLMDGDKAVAKFGIPNPCPGPHPVWKPQPLPITVINGELEISLEKFVADAAQQTTRCTFRVRNHGRDQHAVLVGGFEISDATGNHWRPELKSDTQETIGWVPGSFYGALWPDEQAWKLRVEFIKPGYKDAKDRVVAVAEFLAKPEQVGR